MKNIFTLYIFIALSVVAASQTQYNISFEDTDFSFVETDNGYKISTENLDYYYLSDTTAPALPYKNIYILIPENTIPENVSFEISTKKILNNVSIEKNPIESPTYYPNIITNKNIIDSTEVIYPSTNLQFESVIKIQDYHIAAFSVCPFLYNTQSRSLKFITNMSITFDLNTNMSINQNSSDKKRFDMKNVIKKLVVNSQEITEMYSNIDIPSNRFTAINIDYLIITNENLKDYFIPLKAWKIRKGVNTVILTTDYIYAHYAGSTNQLKIKNCIYDYYQNKGLKWVLLGGDNTIVPVQGCYCKNSNYIDETIPCDLFYSCFDNTFNWDANNNGIIGELADNIDMAPEVYISRAPLRDIAHVVSFVNKTIEYETEADVSIYANTMLLTGTNLFDYPQNGESDAHYKSEQMYSNYILPYWSGTKTKFYDTGTDFTGNDNYDLTATNLQTVLNNGYHFVHMATHGEISSWSMETGSSYMSSYASSQTNSKHSIIITIACNTNAFDKTNDPCLSEAFLRNPNGGCVLYWGSSRYGWSVSSWYFNHRFFNNLFAEGQSYNYKFAAITSAAKSYYISSSSNYNSKRWLQMSLNAIGDPEMSIYTDNPMEFTNATVSQSGTTVIVATGGVSDCTIALTSMDFGETYFVVKEGVSYAVFIDVETPYYVTITKHNYKPYIYPANIYIQNEFISVDKYYAGKNIYVGKNVNPTATQGDVIIEDGTNVILNADEDVHIEGGFEIETTGSMEIR